MINVIEIVDSKEYFEELQRASTALSYRQVNEIADALLRTHESGGTVYTFGNGGSASLASHFACDLGKGTAYCNGGKRFHVLSLADNTPILTAWANDYCFEDVFSEQLKGFVRPGDVAFAISASGNSKNVLRALQAAREAGATTIGISGFQGGQMRPLCDFCVVVPSNNMQIIEDVHLSIAHAIFRIVHTKMSRRAMTASSAI